MTRLWKLAGLGAIALTTIAATAITPAPVRAEMPEMVWMVGPSANVEVVSGEIQDMVGDRVRVVSSDGAVRLIGITQIDRTRLGLDPGDRITVALVDGRFFAQAVALGDNSLMVRNGYIQMASTDGVAVSSSSSTVRTTTVQQRVTTEPAPAAPVRGMW